MKKRLLLGPGWGLAICLMAAFCARPGMSLDLTAGQMGKKSNGPFEVIVQSNVRVAMRDGTKLACDLYLPANAGKAVKGKHPTLLARTPYNKTGQAAEARWFAGHGYAVILND